MPSRFIHVGACLRIPFLFKAELYSIACLYHIVCIHLSISKHLGCFYLVAIVSNAALNMAVQTHVQTPAFSSLGNIPRSRIARLDGHSTFKFSRNCHTVLLANISLY